MHDLLDTSTSWCECQRLTAPYPASLGTRKRASLLVSGSCACFARMVVGSGSLGEKAVQRENFV